MKTTAAISTITPSRRLASSSNTNDPTIERALGLLAEGGITFEVVDRCPAACSICDDLIPHAA